MSINYNLKPLNKYNKCVVKKGYQQKLPNKNILQELRKVIIIHYPMYNITFFYYMEI